MASLAAALGLSVVYLLLVTMLTVFGRYLAHRPYEGSRFAYYQHVLGTACVAFVLAWSLAPSPDVGWLTIALTGASSLLFYGSFYFYSRPLRCVDLSYFVPVLNVAFLIEIAIGILVFREPVTTFAVAGSLLVVLGATVFLFEPRAPGGNNHLDKPSVFAVSLVILLSAGSDVLARFVLEKHEVMEVFPFFFLGGPALLVVSLASRRNAIRRVGTALARRPVVALLFALEVGGALFLYFAYGVLLKDLGLVISSAIFALAPLALVIAVVVLAAVGVRWIEHPTRTEARFRFAGALLIGLGLVAYALG